MTPPRMKRRRSGTSSSACCSETAATGAMRTARRAGLMAETSVTPTPTTRQTMTVRASNTSGPDGSVTPNPLSSFSSPMAASTPRPRPISDDTSPTIGRLAEDGAEHLAAARPDDAQERQLPRALAHDDGERVQDGEAADEERDEGEDEQRRVEEAQRLADGARRLVDDGLAGDHLDAVRQDPRDGALDGRLVGARLGDDVDGVELAHLAQERLGRRDVEGGQRGPGQVVGRPEARQARDGEGPASAPAAGSAPAGPP